MSLTIDRRFLSITCLSLVYHSNVLVTQVNATLKVTISPPPFQLLRHSAKSPRNLMSPVINWVYNNCDHGSKIPDNRHRNPTRKEAFYEDPVPVERQRPEDKCDQNVDNEVDTGNLESLFDMSNCLFIKRVNHFIKRDLSIQLRAWLIR
jgi:hypothetical protein